MQNYHIIFTEPKVASLVIDDLDPTLTGTQVLVKTDFTAISAGTERDNLLDEPNLYCDKEIPIPPFPRHFGYSGSGTVIKVGPDCKRLRAGQRVVVYFGTHSKYNIYPEEKLFPVLYEDIPAEIAALTVIAGFPAEGVRKARLEFGESALVMGLGILGLIGVQLCKAAGAAPVIAADPQPSRRALALKIGADYALDPTLPDFFRQVKALTDGRGIDVAVDAAGNAQATSQAMECLRRFGRMTLVGCTRHHGQYDLYHLVHGKGASIIGANNLARPQFESRPGNWTAYDDNYAIQKLLHFHKLDMRPLINEIHSPQNAPAVYDRLLYSKEFPIGVLFDWNRIGE